MNRITKAVKKRLRHYSLFYPTKKHDALRWGIIGLGNMAEVFASILDEDKESRIVAVASRSKSKAMTFAGRHGRGNAYGSYKEMLNDKGITIDVVYIATPAKCHADHIKMCLDAGKNVLCEKPIALNPEELVPLIEKAKEKKLFLMEGMWMKCLPTFQKAKQWLEQGKIGNLELVKVDFYKREQIDSKLTIFNAEKGGGVLHDFGIYALSFVTSFMTGEPKVIKNEMRKSSFNIDADWQICANSDKVRAFVSLSSNFKGESKAALIGSNGVIEFDAQFNRTNKIVRYDEYGRKQEEYKVNYIHDGFEYEIEEVRHCIRAQKTQSDNIPLSDSLVTIRLMDVLSEN